MSTPEPKFDKVSSIVLHFADRLLLVFSYQMFHAEFRKDLPLLNDPSPVHIRGYYTLRIIRKACLCTTLMALRDLNEILSHRPKKQPGDLKAYDIGFPKGPGFLTGAERHAINMEIIHSTERAGLEDRNTSLDMIEVYTKGVAQGLRFLAWVKEEYPSQEHSLTRFTADYMINEVQSIMKYLQKKNCRAAPPSTRKGVS